MSQSRRRQFLIATGVLLSAPFVRAQPTSKRFRIGVLQFCTEADCKLTNQAFLTGLRERGYAIEQNLIADFRYSDGWKPAQALADELIALKPDVLVGHEATAMVMQARTKSIPIVLLISSDPVTNGLIQSLARPGTNVTGMSAQWLMLVSKKLDLLTEIIPRMLRVGVLLGSKRDAGDPWGKAALQAAKAKGLTLISVRASDTESLRDAFSALKRQGAEGLVIPLISEVARLHKDIIDEVLRLRIPAVAGHPAFPQGGGLISYGVDFEETYRYAAKFVDLILKGAKPGDLPVEQVSQFQLIANLKAAKELGIAIPQSILLRADRVIE